MREQFHRNCYTVPKIKAILKYLNFEEEDISLFHLKGDCDPMIEVRARKK